MKMKQLFNYRISICSNYLRLPLIAFLLSMSIQVKAQEKSLVAISHQSGAPAAMKMSELRSVLMGEKQRWKNGSRVIIALMKTSTSIGKTTSERIYDMTGDELNKFWLALVFQGKAQAPNFFNSVTELENFVAQNPGAIGVLNKSANDSDIKDILIDGQKVF
jgi:F0F1-type ATP synthase beta subunit